MNREPLVRCRGLSKTYVARRRSVTALHPIDLEIYRGEVFGLVGESGCGKSTLGRTLLRLIEPSSGQIEFDGVDLTALSPRKLKGMRQQMQFIFQDPYASLNPRMPVLEIIGEALDIHHLAKKDHRRERVLELLDLVGLEADASYRYPHEFSGGQRQRIGIARALATEPSFVVCDEPISALDLSVQAQVINLLKDLQKKMGLTYLLITHDLSMVRHASDRVGVMYLGAFCEIAESEVLYGDPKHPYTQALLSAIPIPDPHRERSRSRIVLSGDPPSPLSPPAGCLFHTRCPKVMPRCRIERPQMQRIKDGAWVACHLYDRKTPLFGESLSLKKRRKRKRA